MCVCVTVRELARKLVTLWELVKRMGNLSVRGGVFEKEESVWLGSLYFREFVWWIATASSYYTLCFSCSDQ